MNQDYNDITNNFELDPLIANQLAKIDDEEQVELPKEDKSNKGLEITKGVFSYLLFNYFILAVLVIAMIFYPDIDVKDYKTLIKLDVVSSLFVSIVLVILYSKLIISDKNKIKQQGKRGIKKFFEMCLVGFVSFMGVKILASIVETTMFGIFGLEYQTSENQSLIEQMTGSAPLLMAISACIFAPITEELLFRGAIKNIIKNKKVFITVSGLIFGLIHVTDSILLIFEIAVIGVLLDTIIHKESIDKSDKILLSVTMTVILLIIFGGIFYFQYGNLIFKLQSLDMAEVIGSITYIIMGVYLAYLYAKHDSILLNMGIHAFNNIFSMIMILSLI